jgi:hypothetical protein
MVSAENRAECLLGCQAKNDLVIFTELMNKQRALRAGTMCKILHKSVKKKFENNRWENISYALKLNADVYGMIFTKTALHRLLRGRSPGSEYEVTVDDTNYTNKYGQTDVVPT